MSIRIFAAALLFFFFSACSRIELFEKVVFTPVQQWEHSFQPEIIFDIQDTTSSYNIYFIFRHTDAYLYNNVWIKLHSKLPGEKTENTERYDIPLATGKRWLGTGMDDIFDHRVLLYKDPVKFSKPGKYTIRIEQDMRVDPIENVFNVGLRLEKVK
jgi:gliding motility-associated lipoprotein GldH